MSGVATADSVGVLTTPPRGKLVSTKTMVTSMRVPSVEVMLLAGPICGRSWKYSEQLSSPKAIVHLYNINVSR